jgi:hypothetical protein
MDQDHKDYADGPPRRGSRTTLKDVAGCLVVAMILLDAMLVGLYGFVMKGAHDE